MLKKIALIAGLAIISTNALAAKQRSFERLDTNQDQQLSLEEFLKSVKAQNTPRMTKIFKFRDKNGDGFLVNEEYQLKKKKRKKEKKAS